VHEIVRGRTPDRLFGSLKLTLVVMVVLFATAATASRASASTVRFESATKTIFYAAGAGETNRVVVTVVTADTANYNFSDPGAVISDGDGPAVGCEPAPPPAAAGTFRCPKAGVQILNVETGDLNDTITLSNLRPADVPDQPGGPVQTVLDGGDGGDTINGSFMQDQIQAGPGADRVFALEGNDTIDSGFGGGTDVRMDGGAGVDTMRFADRPANYHVEAELRPGLTADSSRSRAHAKEFDLTGGGFVLVGEVRTLASIENLIGGDGPDLLVGGIDNNVLIGGLGADTLCGALGDDTVDYSGSPGPVNVSLDGSMEEDPLITTTSTLARSDCRQVTPAGDSISDPNDPNYKTDCVKNDGTAGEGDCVGEDVEEVIGSPQGDTLVGSDPSPLYGGGPRVEPSGINLLDGGGGDDTLDGGLGPDILNGGPGNDTVTYAGRQLSVKASIDGAANDGGELDRNLAYPDYGRSDSIGMDVENIVGGSADDVLRGDESGNVLEGGGGSDALAGNGGNDSLKAGAGDDSLQGGPGSDVLEGDGGQDTLDGGTGRDAISGGDGTDLVDYSNEIDPVWVTPDGAADDGTPGEGDNVAPDVESIGGTPAADMLFGNAGDGVLNGGGGDDYLDGGGGADILSGGAGIDSASYAARSGPVSVDLNVFGGDGEAGENDTVSGDVERVLGGSGADRLIGDGNANILVGAGGNDTLSGEGGPDALFGGVGNDTMNGNDGNDTLFGDDGNDKLLGGAGPDGLNGGNGNDSLDGGAANDVLTGAAGTDTAVYATRTKDVEADVRGADNSGEKNERDQIRTNTESVSTGSGDDLINIRDGGKGEAKCGRGIDTVLADPGDKIAADCEQANVAASGRCSVKGTSISMSRKGTVKIRVACPVAAKGMLRIAGAGKRLGSKRFSLKAGKSATLTVKLSSKAKRMVRRKKKLKASVTISPRRGATVSRSTKRVTIKASKGKR
jgi:Ca2+-binding RTX toxin-like protein